ncbi:MAG: hypothetical protein ABIL09_19710 [Gemmatimonadota bacterium]
MDRVFEIHTVLTGELAELYAAVIEQFEHHSHIPLSEANRVLLQTGIIQHLVMLQGLGLFRGDRQEAVDALIDRLSQSNIMGDIVALARRHWREAAGAGGSIDLQV